MNSNIQIGNVLFEQNSFPIIAGPCVIESRDHAMNMASDYIPDRPGM